MRRKCWRWLSISGCSFTIWRGSRGWHRGLRNRERVYEIVEDHFIRFRCIGKYHQQHGSKLNLEFAKI